MPKLFDLVKVNIATAGTGTVAFGSAFSNAFLTPSEAGCVDGDSVRYILVDGTDVEVGTGVIGGSVTTMTRTVLFSKVGGVKGTTALNLSGTAYLALDAISLDILNPANNLSELPDQATAQDNLGVAADNLVVNPQFLVDQFNAHAAGITVTDNGYFADVFRYVGEASATCYSDLPGGAIRATGTTDKFGVFQAIEASKSVSLRNKTVTLSAILDATNARIGNVKMGILQWTGSADATTSDPISSWGADGTTPTLNANWSFVNTPANLSVTTTPTKYSVTGTVGSLVNNLAILIWNDDKSYTAGDGLDFTCLDLHAGKDRPYRPTNLADDLEDVQFYIEPLYTASASCYSTTLAIGSGVWSAKRDIPSLSLITAGQLVGNGTTPAVSSISSPTGMHITGGTWSFNSSSLVAGNAMTWRSGIIAVASRI